MQTPSIGKNIPHIFFFFAKQAGKHISFKQDDQIFQGISMQLLILLKGAEGPAILLCPGPVICVLQLYGQF